MLVNAVVAGAVAASGPVNAKPDFPEYLTVVDTALRSEGEQCSLSVKRAVSRVISLTRHSLGQHKLGKMFRLCQPLEASQAGVATLVGPLAGGVLVDHLGWQWIFFVNVPVGAVGLVLALRLVPSLPTPLADLQASLRVFSQCLCPATAAAVLA